MITRSVLQACYRFLVGLIHDLRAVAVPAQCPSCLRRVEARGRLCRRCYKILCAELEQGCVLWRSRERWTNPGRRIRATAVGKLTGVWGRLIRVYKEDPDPQVSALLEPIWSAFVTARMSRDAGVGVVLVPVPMAAVRRRQRGFNPTEGLAGIASRISGRPVLSGALMRVRYMGPLRGKGAVQRRAEMLGAFAPGPDAALVSGARVVLIDDVATTGATLGAAAATLRGMGAAGSIRVWVLGRTPRRGSGNSYVRPTASRRVGKRRSAAAGAMRKAVVSSPEGPEAGSARGHVSARHRERSRGEMNKRDVS